MRLQVSEYTVALDDIWDYYAKEASERVADRITKKIVDDIDRLLTHPRSGQYEPLLEHLGLKHRRLASGDGKIIYRIMDDLIFVSDIFDAREDTGEDGVVITASSTTVQAQRTEGGVGRAPCNGSENVWILFL